MSTTSAPPAGRPAPGSDASRRSFARRRQVERASAEWRAGLIDVSGSNRLLFFRPTAATLSLADAEPGALADLLAGASVKLARLFADPARRAVAFKACKALAAKQREAVEEYGVSVAFLALGMATWARDPEDALEVDAEAAVEAGVEADVEAGVEPDAGARARPARSAGARPPAAPVLLRAVELTARPGASDSFELTLTGEAQLNPVLAHVLAGQGVHLDEEELLAAGDDDRGVLEPIYDQLRKVCGDVPGFAIRDEQVIGPFSYLKQPMVADCEDIEALLASDLVAALAGDEDAVAGTRAQAGQVGEADPDYTPVQAEHLILDADASQSYVVNAALAGRNLVIQGPPGTGKSQTIANVIACLVADGKKVLFVAQKRAAITAVLDRLAGAGLEQLTLDLFAAGASRRFVGDQLRTVLDNQAAVREPVTGALHQALTASRDRLVSHRDALHVRTHAWGITAAQALAASYALPQTAATPVRIPAATLAGWGPHDLEAHVAALTELVARGGLHPELFTRPGWSATALTGSDLVASANEDLLTLRSELLPACLDAIDALEREAGTQAPDDPAGVAAMLAEFHEVAALLDQVPGALATDLDDATLERYLAATDKAYRKARRIKVGWLERRRLRRQARGLLGAAAGAPDAVGDRDLHQLLARAHAARDRWAARGASGPARGLATLDDGQRRFSALGAGLARLAPALQHLDLLNVPLPDLAGVLDQLAADRGRAQLPRLHELETQLAGAGCGQVLAALRRTVAAGQQPGDRGDGHWAGDQLRYAAIHSVLDQALTADPALAGITGEHLDDAAEEFAARDRDHLQANAARVRRTAAVRLTQVLDANPEQHTRLRAEVTRKRNFTPVRRLFEHAPDVMTAVKPVWAMSPLQVSRLLPAAPCFDVVIFDEASQVKPADAIPALLRAPQAVVAGDSRQLPPTEFFTKVLEASTPAADLATEEELAAEAAEEDAALTDAAVGAPRAARQRQAGESYTQDAESILFAFDRILAGQSRRLLWHYRSRDERLIATSNVHVYAGSLTTFPAADGHDCLRHEVVPPSPGIRGGTNSPAEEVRRVVDLVLDHARTRPTETLGVITFGVAHARRVEAALESAFAEHPDLEAVLDADEREPFFVKNIERVQGDERDAIILSVGYGKTLEGRMRFFWGPLLKDGGERRLNVAISRARSRMALVTSFTADDVPEDAHTSEGFRLMYRFLRFMASGGTDLSGGTHVDVPLNPFEIDVRDRLTVAGLDLVPQLGVGSYRLDFAARHPDQPGRYVLAIEADGANYHSGHIARERDRLRQRLLEARGWTFHRIWSTDWFDDAESEVAAALAAYNAALTADAVARHEKEPADPPAAGTPSWHLAETRRTVPRPQLTPRLPIDKYDPALLAGLVRHVRSDGVLRTRDDELAVLMAELGFAKRGRRIVAALTTAQNQA